MSDQYATPAPETMAELEHVRARVRQVTNQAHNTLNDGGRLLDAGRLDEAKQRLQDAARLLQNAADLIPDR